MDLVTLLTAIPMVGPYLPYILLAGALASAVATVLPAPSANANAAYAGLYRAINWLALNVGHAKNAADPAVPVKPSSGTVGVILAMVGMLLIGSVLTACSSQQIATAGVTAPTAAAVANAVDPAVVAKIDAVCPAVQNGLAIAAVAAKGGAADTVANLQNLAASSCTAAGVVSLAANDAAPVTATNSGDSAAWLNSLLTDAALAAKVALAVAPLL